ncbi:solute carrier organic anion transporter family member 4A1-like isoform X1 [Clavelina lepadiformis]|uniref:solute carrier organic anion transporter family member 4A1-like isoform X1 n=1 Tax=Clavelina lepadiformis TaxID=159417 RepID=UPI0040411A55
MLKYCSFAVFSVACLSCCFLLHCRDTQIAGVNVPYSDSSFNSVTSTNLTSSCNSHCPCQEAYYIPVCGPEEVTYFSACQAGCTEVNYFVQPTVYSNCSCFPNSTDEAVDGRCPSPCSTRSAFLALSFFMVMFTFSIFTPMLVSTFRIVPESLRSFALGLEYLFYRALGTIPGPNLYGAFIDATCLLWQETSCGDRGFCWTYNNRNMALTFLYLSVVGNGLSALLFLVGSFTYKPMYVAECSTDMDTVQLSTDSDKDGNKKSKGHTNYPSYDGNLYENAKLNEDCTKL